MSLLYESDYYTKNVETITMKRRLPEVFAWFGSGQFEPVEHKRGQLKFVQWDAIMNENPTTNVNDFNTVSTVEFSATTMKVTYLPVQFKFKHLKPSIANDYINDGFIGDPNNGLLPFDKAFTLACNEIDKMITYYVLTGDITVRKDGKSKKHLPENMVGLADITLQVREEVASADIGKIDKIMEKVKEGLPKLQWGDYYRTPVMVLMDKKMAPLFKEPHTIGTAPNLNVVQSKTWKDALIDAIQGINDDQPVFIRTSNILEDKMVILPMNPELLKFKASKNLLPTINEHRDTNSSDVVHSYLDFVLGGIVATDKTILQIVKKA